MRLAVLLLVLLGLFTPAHAAKRVALVIGNSAYVHANPLPNPANDAEDMVKKLTELGFAVTSGKDLDLNGMRDTVRGFIKNLEGAELAIFYYAGHGLQVKGTNYMVPINAKLATEDDVGFEAMAMETVLVPMERVSRTNLVFLDACRDNPLAKNLARSLGTRSAVVGQGLAQLGSGVGTLVSFATQPGNVALDGNGRNSPFTKALLKHLGTPGQDITRDMVMVRRDVIAATSGNQVPWDNSSLTGDVILQVGIGAPPPVEPLPAALPKSDGKAVVISPDGWASLTPADKPDRSDTTFDGMWSLTRTAKKADCAWSSMEGFIEVKNGKIDHPDWKGAVKSDGSIKITLSFIDEFNGGIGHDSAGGVEHLAGHLSSGLRPERYRRDGEGRSQQQSSEIHASASKEPDWSIV